VEAIEAISKSDGKERSDGSNQTIQASKSTSAFAPSSSSTATSVAAPIRSTFTFGAPLQSRQKEDTVTPALPATFTFSKPSSTAPAPVQKKNDALDIVMATAGATSAVPYKLTPAIFSTPPEQEANTTSPRDDALATDSGALPVYVFRCLTHVPSIAAGTSFAAQQKAKAMPIDQLPAYKFDDSSRSYATSSASTTKEQPDLSSNAPLASSGFTGWGATVKPSSSNVAQGGTWTCDVCSLQSKAASTECDVCEAPRPGNAPASRPAVTGGFTGWGANLNPPPATSGSGQDWTCGLCGCKSKATSQQCDVCETKRG
jgi:hypothetical protein